MMLPIAALDMRVAYRISPILYEVRVSRQTINAIETEKYDPSLPLALKIGRLFDQAVEAIFTLDDFAERKVASARARSG